MRARTGQKKINPDYKSLGYNSIYEGMIGEAEKEGRGEEVRERLEKFQQTNKIKAASVLVVAIGSFLAARSAYWSDPDSFLPGIWAGSIEEHHLFLLALQRSTHGRWATGAVVPIVRLSVTWMLSTTMTEREGREWREEGREKKAKQDSLCVTYR